MLAISEGCRISHLNKPRPKAKPQSQIGIFTVYPFIGELAGGFKSIPTNDE